MLKVKLKEKEDKKVRKGRKRRRTLARNMTF